MYLSSMWLGVNVRMDTKRFCEHEIGLCAQNYLIIVGLRVNMIGRGLYDYLRRKRILTLKMNAHVLQKLEGKWLQPQFDFANQFGFISRSNECGGKSVFLGPIILERCCRPGKCKVPWSKNLHSTNKLIVGFCNFFGFGP